MVIHEDGKKIETGSVKEDYRKSYRIFLLLFLISFSLNLIILFFYLEKETPWRSVLKERKETGGGEQRKSLKDGGQIAVLRINQDYASDSFRAFRSEGDTKDQFRDFG
jgi:hypothetical protein